MILHHVSIGYHCKLYVMRVFIPLSTWQPVYNIYILIYIYFSHKLTMDKNIITLTKRTILNLANHSKIKIWKPTSQKSALNKIYSTGLRLWRDRPLKQNAIWHVVMGRYIQNIAISVDTSYHSCQYQKLQYIAIFEYAKFVNWSELPNSIYDGILIPASFQDNF